MVQMSNSTPHKSPSVFAARLLGKAPPPSYRPSYRLHGKSGRAPAPHNNHCSRSSLSRCHILYRSVPTLNFTQATRATSHRRDCGRDASSWRRWLGASRLRARERQRCSSAAARIIAPRKAPCPLSGSATKHPKQACPGHLRKHKRAPH